MTADKFDTATGARMDPITPTTPLPLEEAAKIAFPNGRMTALVLRRQATRGNLAIEKIGNRVFTTLADIEEMRQRCRVNPKDQGAGSGKAARTTEGSVSRPGYGLAVADGLLRKLKKPYLATASKSGKGR